MRFRQLARLAGALTACTAVAGCGGGGGGGGGPAPIPPGTFTATAAGGPSFAPNVLDAVATGTTVQISADQRTGPTNAYTSSHRLVLTLYRPVTAGATYAISATHASGTATALYVETVLQGDKYVTTGTWEATGGSISVNAADGSHIEGTFTLTTRNAATGNTITWNNGAFNLSYESPPPPPG